MTRKLKTLGVALFAVLALTAVSASAASAASYTASSYPATATGESAVGNDVFTTEGGTVECKSHYTSTLSAASKALTVTPTYTNCKAFGFLEATVTGCKYEFTEPTGSGDTYSTNTDVTGTCTIKASTCHVTVQTQNGLGSVAITNNTAAGDISLKANVTGIGYTVITDGFLCPFNGTGAKTGATYTQKSPVTADSAATISIG